MTWLLLGLLAAAVADDVRLRWGRWRRDRPLLAQVDGIDLPAPDDPRWVGDKVPFIVAGVEKVNPVMRLGHIVVDSDGWVFIRRDHGSAAALPDSKTYGLAVWRAYNARRALDSMLS